jgi:hypothetical protein
MPVIGFVHAASPATYAVFVDAFRQGLRETGYIEGQNVRIEFVASQMPGTTSGMKKNITFGSRIVPFVTPKLPMSALPPKADIRQRDFDVRFVPIADIAGLI